MFWANVLEDIGIENSKSALDELVSKSTQDRFCKTENAKWFIDKIAVGTTIQIKAGEMIPLDGKIISGETMVDEAAITGEPIPKTKHTGDNLFAGTLNKMVSLKWKQPNFLLILLSQKSFT